MPRKFSFGNKLSRSAVPLGFLLGFLGCLVAQETRSATIAQDRPQLVTSVLGFGDHCATGINLADELDVAVEDQDSSEMFRVNIEQCAFSIDSAVSGSNTSSKVARTTLRTTSSPLLE